MGDGQVLVAFDTYCAVDFVAEEILQRGFKTQYTRIEPLVPVFPDGVVDVKTIVDNTIIVEAGHAPMVVAEVITKRQVRRQTRQSILKEELRRNRPNQKHVIVEENKML